MGDRCDVGLKIDRAGQCILKDIRVTVIADPVEMLAGIVILTKEAEVKANIGMSLSFFSRVSDKADKVRLVNFFA